MASGKNNPVFAFKEVRQREISAYAKEVVQMLANGLRVQDVANIKHVSPRTLEKHITDIRSEVGAKTTTHLVAFFLRNKFIE